MKIYLGISSWKGTWPLLANYFFFESRPASIRIHIIILYKSVCHNCISCSCRMTCITGFIVCFWHARSRYDVTLLNILWILTFQNDCPSFVLWLIINRLIFIIKYYISNYIFSRLYMYKGWIPISFPECFNQIF